MLRVVHRKMEPCFYSYLSNDSVAFTFEPNGENARTFDATYYYEDSDRPAIIKTFDADGFLREETYYSKVGDRELRQETFFRTHFYKNKKLTSIGTIENGKHQPRRSAEKQSLIQKLFKISTEDIFHNDNCVNVQNTFLPYIKDRISMFKHIKGEIEKAEEYNEKHKNSCQKRSNAYMKKVIS